VNDRLDHHGIGMTSARTRDRLVQRLREQGISDHRVLEQIPHRSWNATVGLICTTTTFPGARKLIKL